MQSKHLWSSLLNGAVLHDDPMMSDTSRSLTNTDHCYAEDNKSRQNLKREMSDKSVSAADTRETRKFVSCISIAPGKV